MPSSPLKLAALISGGGTTLQNLLDAIAAGTLDARVAAVVASRPGILGLERARNANVPSFLVERVAHADAAAFSRRVFAHCDEAGVDLICLAGWLSFLEVPPRYAGRIMNIHPSLLPSFGGPGMYGRRVHQAVIDHGCKVSGCTVHFVDGAYDDGPIILQRPCDVANDDTPETLASRVARQEALAYPEAVRLFQAGRLRVEGRRVRLLPEENVLPR